MPTPGSPITSDSATSSPSGVKPESVNLLSDLQSAAPNTRRSRTNVRDKAARLLLQGRLRVVKVDGDLVVAECRGDSGGVYSLGFDPKVRQWRCTCEARTACSHLHSLWAVTAVER